jgi:hypothetical protein
MIRLYRSLVVSGLLALGCAVARGDDAYRWVSGKLPEREIANAIPPPAGFERTAVAAGLFADWLRHLPLKPPGTAVHLYNGKQKGNQDVHHAVVDIDTGSKDLQQCADAVIRLRAEYLYSRGETAAIHFKFTSGDEAVFARWAEGYRPVVAGNRVRWIKRASADASYGSFRRYLDVVFSYAGTLSLSRELSPRKIDELEIGDVFIRGGSPGHAVIVVDLAVNKATGKKVFLLAQSYMPAQDIHVLKNSADAGTSPWYPADFGEVLQTPEWTFQKNELMRFPPEKAKDRGSDNSKAQNAVKTPPVRTRALPARSPDE